MDAEERNWERLKLLNELYERLVKDRIFIGMNTIETFRLTCYSLPWIRTNDLTANDILSLWQRYLAETPDELLNDPMRPQIR